VTPAARVLEAEGIDPELAARISGRIVLVGSSAQGLFDIRTTPLDPAVAGVTLHAEIIEQIVAGNSCPARLDAGAGDRDRGADGAVAHAAATARTAGLSLAAALVLVGAPALGGILAFAAGGCALRSGPAGADGAGGVPARHHHRLHRQGTRAPRHPRALRLFPAARADRRIEANPEAALTPKAPNAT
jgi:adenylate cyclase